MDHNGHFSHAINNLECDGSVAGMKGGTWKGHVGPGILFIIWGSWWAYSVLSYLVFSSKHHRRPSQNYISKSWYPMPFRWLYYTEPILKIILPLFYVSVELYLDHPDGFQYLHCPKGTQFAGRFALSHLNNWQHASTYPPIVLSGLIDLLSTRVLLPQGTGHVFLAVAFAVQSFVMGTHQKHQPQDQMVHWLLFLSMSLCFLFILLELNAPKNPLPALGRGAAVIFQGAWLCVIGKIEFENLPQWSEEYSGGAMMAPIYFVTVWVVVLCAVTGLGLFMAAVQHFNLLPLALLSQGISDSVASNFGVISHKEGKDFGRDHSGGYLELSCCDTTQHARHDESTNLLPLSIRRSPQPLGELECFETDSARHTTTSSPCTSSSGNGSPRSSTSFAFPTHHSPEDRV